MVLRSKSPLPALASAVWGAQDSGSGTLRKFAKTCCWCSREMKRNVLLLHPSVGVRKKITEVQRDEFHPSALAVDNDSYVPRRRWIGHSSPIDNRRCGCDTFSRLPCSLAFSAVELHRAESRKQLLLPTPETSPREHAGFNRRGELVALPEASRRGARDICCQRGDVHWRPRPDSESTNGISDGLRCRA